MAINIADLFEHAVDVAGPRTALACGPATIDYAGLEARANRLAHHLAAHGVTVGSHVGIYARNGIEYVEAMLAAYKLRAVAININYRYVAAELDYLFGDADLVALVHQRGYAPLVAEVIGRHPMLRHVVVVNDGSGADYAGYGGVDYETALAAASPDRDFGPRSADDRYVLYTGGTTGYPKGVVWRHGDIWRVLGGGIDFLTSERLTEYDQQAKATQPGVIVHFPVAPLMHGAAQWATMMNLFVGGLVVLTPVFDPDEVWRAVAAYRVNVLAIVGDAMARPLIEAYERADYDAGTLLALTSTAAVFSPVVKRRCLELFPGVVLTDAIGSSEAGFSGIGMIDATNVDAGGLQVSIGAETAIVDDDDRVLDPVADIGKAGRVARSGSVPVEYYKDPAKSARTFVQIEGTRYSIPGDYARIEPGGRVTLLGRGSQCVNTGGEKVFPEEVEAALKAHPAVFDALVVGLPDDRLGQRVAAVVQVRPGTTVDLGGLRGHLDHYIAGYKMPRTLVVVDEVPRHSTGKPDYPRAAALAAERGGRPEVAKEHRAHQDL